MTSKEGRKTGALDPEDRRAFFIAIMDKRKKSQKKRDAGRDPVTGKSIYEKIIDGDIEPEGCQKGWKNLRPVPITQRDPEERKEICRKGAAAVNKLHGKEKTAREALKGILSLIASDEIIDGADIEPALVDRLKKSNPELTTYELMQAVALGRALAGSIQAATYIRDTAGDKPENKIDISADIMTEADRALLDNIAGRLDGGTLQIVKDITEDGTGRK